MRKRILYLITAALFVSSWVLSGYLIQLSILWIIPITIVGAFIMPMFGASIIFEYMNVIEFKNPDEVSIPYRATYEFLPFFKISIIISILAYIVMLILNWKEYILLGIVPLLILWQAPRYTKSVFYLFKKKTHAMFPDASIEHIWDLFEQIVVQGRKSS